MKKFKRRLAALICGVLLLTGCSNDSGFGKLPDNPVVFEQEIFTNPDNAEDAYACIVYHGRTYVPYGTLGGTIHKSDVRECIGYIYDKESPEDTSARVYTLEGDDGENYLMDILTEAFMEQPSFYRAIDTRGKDVKTPKFIHSLDYDYWK